MISLQEEIHNESKELIEDAYRRYIDGLIDGAELAQILDRETELQVSLEMSYGIWNSDDGY